MSIKDQDQPQSHTQTGRTSSSRQQTQREEQPARRPFSFGSGGGLFAAPIGTGLGSEYLNKLREAMNETYKQSLKDPTAEISLLTLDNTNETALAFSAIVVCVRFADNPELGVAFHTLIVEGTGDALTPVSESIGNQPVEIVRVTGDALDEVLMQKVDERVRSSFPQGLRRSVDGSVVPRTFNPENKVHVHRLALNAALACATELEINKPDFVDFNLAHAGNDNALSINIGFSRQQMEDAVGDPMRSDVLVNFATQATAQQRSQSVNAVDRTQKISEISGFLDVLWAPVQQGPVFNQYMQSQGPAATQKYVSRLVITNMASNFSYTPASVLLSLNTAMALRDQNNWIQGFRGTQTDDEVDLHDIGALGIEANFEGNPNGFGSRIDTKSETFGLPDLGQLVAALFQPGLIISLDVPEAGPQTWYTSLFSAASKGSQQAIDAIYDAAMELTNGNFAKYFQQGTPMFQDLNNRVHLGYYTDKNGNRRDIRDIDYLAVANLVGERNPQAIRDWSDTFTRYQYPLAQRLAARKRMIMSLTRESAIFTGFAHRVTPSAALMGALSQGAMDAGLAVDIRTPLSSSEFSNERGVANFVAGALMAPGQSFGAVSTGFQNYNYGMGMGTNRW